MWRSMGLDDESMERSWYGALQLMRDQGQDPDEVLRKAVEALKDVVPGTFVFDPTIPWADGLWDEEY